MPKFEVVKHRLDESIKLPVRATVGSAGYDFYSPQNIDLFPGERYVLPTGIKAYMAEDEVLNIYVRSSLALDGISIIGSSSIIDSDYAGTGVNDGEIQLMLKNDAEHNIVRINKDDRIAQGIFYVFLRTDDDATTTIRTGGSGSSGK